jgi:hypothetical protein
MKVESEPDYVDPRFVIGVGVVGAAVTALCCGIAWLVLSWSSAGRGSGAFHQTRVAPPPTEVNQIEADLIDAKAPPPVGSAPGRLQSFGWSERPSGLVHVPLERAFQLYLSGARAAGAADSKGTKP